MESFLSHTATGGLLRELEAVSGALGNLSALEAEPEMTDLSEQVGDIIEIVRSFDQLATAERRNPSGSLSLQSRNGAFHLGPVLDSTSSMIDECALFSHPLLSGIEYIAHMRSEAGYVTPESRLKSQPWYNETSHALRLQAKVLRALFTATDLLSRQNDIDDNSMSRETRSSISTRLHYQIGLAEQEIKRNCYSESKIIKGAITVAKAVTLHIPPTPNKHFVIVRAVKTYFTGREVQLDKLEAAFSEPTQPRQQIFVIFGLSGTGKTELAFKFAHGYRDRFWGVFFVDGSSRKNATSSYAEIATLGGVEPNEKAAKNWLTTRALPWLLIIDNVDDEEINIEELLPPGPKGCVLVTTRNPAHVTYGNTGERYLELLPMEPNDAEALIIKAAGEPRPWPKVVVDSANTICDALGFLPLALIQAAKAILNGICEWPEYLKFYDRQIQRLRRTLHGRKGSVPSHKKRAEDDSSMHVFSTYEILYESLESSSKERYRDAVELLHIFSFFHFQNIRFDVLLSAAINPLKEEIQQKEDDEKERQLLTKLAKPPQKPWIMFLRELRAFINMKLATPLPLPNILRNHDRLGLDDLEDEVEVRLRHALSVLIERSLITRHDRGSGRYSMHRLVHKWVRERPEMSTAHQALWCQISMTTLACSIRRPPHGDNEGENRGRRELLPHVNHVRQCQTIFDRRLEENAAKAKPDRMLKRLYGRREAEHDVRFSRVYAETGNYNEAQQLQQKVLDYVSSRLGPDHPLAIWLSLFLTKTLWEMSAFDKATQQQRQAYQHCISTWGEDHPLSLDVGDLLASALYMKGRWAEATSIQTTTLERMRSLYGENHEKTLRSMRNLGRLYYRYMDFERATILHQKSYDGMRETLGDTHLETLTSLEDLANSYVRQGEEENMDAAKEEELALSNKRLVYVYEERKKQLGEEHPYTLLAILYLARLKSEIGQHLEAEEMIREGLLVAERNVGKDHIAVLLARTIYATVLTKLGRFAKAESIFYMLIDKSRYSLIVDEGQDHPDRLANMWLLAECFERQGQKEKALRMYEEFLGSLAEIGGEGLGMRHRILERAQKKIATLKGVVDGTKCEAELRESDRPGHDRLRGKASTWPRNS
ncbi:hypothetical protein PG996_014287 [Apiospora saccharicola]|uniref:NB-ARC domain-containing protein n=1 Tax=Apiospora saccharicola TaxID=335842 RepID=A0ABR1THW6_9PEZI